MGGFLSPSPQTTNTSGTSTTTYTPSGNTMNQWNQLQGTMQGLTIGPQGVVNNYVYPGQMVAGPSDLTNQYWGSASAYGQYAPNVTDTSNSMLNASGALFNTQQSPSGISLPSYNPSSFQPGQLNLPSFGNIPTVGMPGGQPSGLASSYQVNPLQVQAPSGYTPQQVQAMMVSAPGTVNPITGVPNVNAPSLNQYQMGPAGSVNAPSLQNFTMQAAGNVQPNAQATTQSWTAPGTAQQYMSPYTQQVVNTQLAQAQTQEQQQLAQQNAQAAQAGAFGGTRAAVEAANTSIGYQQLASQLEAQGLQSAYQQGTQQFNTEQALGQQAQQFNIGTGLQAALANQQAQQQANVQNLSAYLQTQGLGAQTGLQAQLANQQAGLTVGQANLGANLQTQQLGATTGLQAALANQSMDYQTQVANQQAQEFGYGQQMQAGLANQQAGLSAQQMNQQAGLQAALAQMGYGMQAQQLNQQAGLQAGLAAQQMGLQGAEFTAGQGLQAGMANQAAAMQGLGMTYQGGLQGALQTQNLGLSGAEYGGQLGLTSAQQQEALQQQQEGLNASTIQNAAGLQAQAAQLGLTGYQTGLQGLSALQQGATSQQGYQQQLADAQYQQWINSMALPIQATMTAGQLEAMQPVPYSMNNVYSGTTTMMPSQPSILSQALAGGIGALSAIGNFFSKGGPVTEKRAHGLALVPKRPKRELSGLGDFAMAA